MNSHSINVNHAENMVELCKQFGLDEKNLNKFLYSTKAIIAGGSMLWCIQPFNDIYLFLSMIQMQKL